MKKIFLLLILCIFAFNSAWAELKVGVVDTKQLLRNSGFAKRATASLEKEFSQREKKLIAQGKKLQQELKSLQAQANVLSALEYGKKKQDFDLREAKFQQEKHLYEADLSSRKMEKMQQLFEIAQAVIKRIAKEEKIDLILEQALYFDPKLDLTPRVLQELDRRNR